MGWSCGWDAHKTMDKISNACILQTGSQNTFVVKGKSFFFEHSRRESHDGAITGSIHRFTANNMCRKAGSFKIAGDGQVERGPKFMKDAAKA